MDIIKENVLLKILEIFQKTEEEKKDVVNIYNSLLYRIVGHALIKEGKEDIAKELKNVDDNKDLMRTVERLINDPVIRKRVLFEIVKSTSEFIQELIKDSTPEQKERIQELDQKYMDLLKLNKSF